MTSRPQRQRAADILTIGFGTTAAMWAAGYFCRLFGSAVPPAVLFGLLLAGLVSGGVVLGRCTSRTLYGGFAVGLLSGALNLLIVGSLISAETPNAIKQGVWAWVPGTLVVSVVCVVVGAALGRRLRAAGTVVQDWNGGLAAVAAGATFVLLAAGGLVTGFDEGLAVVDWPNTEGYNMFLYPLARMTGGVYLEHSHRLLGSLVGLTTLVLAVHVQLTDARRWVRRVAWLALLLVAVQGVLGGLRVTGRMTLSTDAADTSPNILLAIIHGVLGQAVFALLVALAVWRSRAWATAGAPATAPAAGTDRTFGIALVATLAIQLVLGALVRHFTWALEVQRYGLAADPARLAAIGEWALHLHITLAVFITLLAVGVGVRAWGIYRTVPHLPRLGRWLLMLVGVQVVLGIAALIVTGNDALDRLPTALDVAVTTLHQVVGAALLACAAMLLLWNCRLLTPPVAAPRP